METSTAEIYDRLRRAGLREMFALEDQGKEAAVPALEDLVPGLNQLQQVKLGLCQIPMNRIAGTVTSGRTTAFSPSFYPILAINSEFAAKWINLYDSVRDEGLREPVKAYEYYNRYYIIEGNKRISVMKTYNAYSIEANVTRILPEKEDSERWRAYQAFLKFYNDTRVADIAFSKADAYGRLYEMAGRTPGEAWPEDDVINLRAAFRTFVMEYEEQAHGREPLPASDAFLVFLQVNGYPRCMKMLSDELAAAIRDTWFEFLVVSANKPAMLLEQPSDRKPGVLHSLLHGVNHLRCAFLYNASPENSGWTYWHELARQGLPELLGNRVETVAKSNVSEEDAEAVIDSLLDEGWDVIFACSPVFGPACIHASAKHPQARILNCSLLASYYSVRSYYLRVYEAKFVLGALAGILTENGRIGYIADYPIWGVPASINAFALGARMTNPRARIYLEWSTVRDRDPEAALKAAGADLISGRDISAPAMTGSRTFGLYTWRNGEPVSVGMPVWNWAKLYQDILQSIFNGTWEEDAPRTEQRALSYYMGMNTGAIDLVLSRRVPAGAAKLCKLLQEQIASGKLNPFEGPITNQAREVLVGTGAALTFEEIVRMDTLADNVDGRIPALDELTPAARKMAALNTIGIEG